MTKEKIREAMIKAIESVFSEMIFIDTLHIDEAPENFTYTQILYIDIISPVKGYIIAYLPLELRKTIVETIHSIDWDEMHATEIDDCLLEILNVIAGNFMADLLGRDVKYNISFPAVNYDEEDIENLQSSQEIYFNAEGPIFKINVLIND
ncbi:MAG: chemotaxis protein CheX [Spirochaetales bacterium]|nr:chemotaxis protein CheX [Spirochaetales bacterium]